MGDDDIGDDADRNRVEKRSGPAHPEPGELFEHVDDNPHHRLTLRTLAGRSPDMGGATVIYYRSDAELPS